MDYGSQYADKKQKIIEFRLQKVYREAKKDLQKKFEEFTSEKVEKDKEKLKQVQNGEISEREYKSWLVDQAFAEQQWKQKINSATEILQNSNEEALNIIRDVQMDVYSTNANYEAYMMEKDIGTAVNFSIYDETAVQRLIKEKPELLPAKKLNGKKDKAWNQGIISNALTQAIIQGESIPNLAKRLARDTANSNMKAMTRYARTAMTAAQNAGRIDTMHRAENMGIFVRKQWLATLDRRTRDSHRQLDGQEQDIDKPFKSELGDIMYPGDPEANPANVCNCRCTLVHVYPKYENLIAWKGERRDQETGKLIEDMSYREWVASKEVKLYGKPVEREESDVTEKYFKNAKPGAGKITYDKNYDFNDEEDETKIARWLKSTFGGDVHIRQEIDETEGKSYCDYYWRGKCWELKTKSNLTSPETTIKKALNQIKKTPGGIILNFKSDEFDLERVLNWVRRRMKSSGFNADLMILHNGELKCIKRYKK